MFDLRMGCSRTKGQRDETCWPMINPMLNHPDLDSRCYTRVCTSRYILHYQIPITNGHTHKAIIMWLLNVSYSSSISTQQTNNTIYDHKNVCFNFLSPVTFFFWSETTTPSQVFFAHREISVIVWHPCATNASLLLVAPHCISREWCFQSFTDECVWHI